MAVTLDVERADEDDLDYVESMLARNDLPTADLRAGGATFFVGRRDGRRVAVGGLERYGDVGLLRSLVVDESARGTGVGSAMCEALERRAAADGVEAIYLLTTTAADFFTARGYTSVERADVPRPIRESRQFTDLCPSTARCLVSRLSR